MISLDPLDVSRIEMPNHTIEVEYQSLHAREGTASSHPKTLPSRERSRLDVVGRSAGDGLVGLQARLGIRDVDDLRANAWDREKLAE